MMHSRDWLRLVSAAQDRIIDYIDALRSGRSGAAASEQAVYTDLLAGAAELVPMLRNPSTPQPLSDWAHAENRKFPREFLATEGGRAARTAFNHLAAAIGALADHEETVADAPADGTAVGLQALVGEQLSAVTFVQDYVELRFDGQGLTAYGSIAVSTPSGTARTGDADFRNRLCEAIGYTVWSVGGGDEAIAIVFDHGRIDLSLRFTEGAGPEAAAFHDAAGRLSVLSWAA